MKISYDKTIKIGGIGLVPWSRLGPERWLQNYKVASLYEWDVAAGAEPEVYALRHSAPGTRLERANSQQLLENEAFQTMLQTNFSGYKMLTYKPVRVPEALRNITFLSSNQELARQLENKVDFRQLMHGADIPFPPYAVYKTSLLAHMPVAELLNGRSSVIVQDERLSGGKGTYVVDSDKSLAAALHAIGKMRGGTRVVLSERIMNARERSVQACVTRYGTFVGPLQKQIIANPLLANTVLTEGDRFCGAEITVDDPLATTYDEIKRLALQVGQKIQAMGYKGIFSLDCLVDETGKLYVLEINPRITGITPLLTMLHRDGQDIPFYLLHILELAGADYTIEDDYINPTPAEGSLLVFHSLQHAAVKVVDSPPSGLYEPITAAFMQPATRLDATDPTEKLLVQQYTSADTIVKPGSRLLAAMTNGRVLDSHDNLLPATKHQIRSITSKVKVEAP